MNDIERLRKELIDYYGTAAQFYPQAYLEIEKIKKMSDEEILSLAEEVLGIQKIKRR